MRWRPSRCEIALAFAVTLYLAVPAAAFAAHGFRAVFSFLAADAFYYLTIAANVRAHGVVSYDQLHPTNCFHPLWQTVVVAIAATTGDAARVIVRSFVANILLSVGVLVVLGLALRRTVQHVPLALALLPCGVYGLFDPSFHNLWSYTNGLETAVQLLSYAALVAFLIERRDGHLSMRDAIVLGGIFVLLIFARLDSVFFVPAVLTCGLSMRDGWASKRQWLAAAAIPSLAVAIYVAVCRMVFGRALPVSGSAKSTFPHVNVDGLHAVWNVVRGASVPPPVSTLWVPQLAVPLAAAVLLLAYERIRSRRSGSDGWSFVLRASALYIVAFHVYNLLFVSLNHQGFWYFAVSMYAIYVAAVAVLERQAARVGSRTRVALNGLALACAIGGTWVVGYRYVSNTKAYEWVADVQTSVFENRTTLREDVANRAARVYALDDGLFAYSTGVPTINGMGLCVDAETYERSRAGGLPERLREMGVTHVFVPRNYLPFLSVEKGPALRYSQLAPVSPIEIAQTEGAMQWIGRLRVDDVTTAYVLFDVAGAASTAGR